MRILIYFFLEKSIIELNLKQIIFSILILGTIYDVVKEIEDRGGKAFPLCCDVRAEENITNTLSQCLKQFGHLDVAVYNAGKLFELHLIMWTQ